VNDRRLYDQAITRSQIHGLQTGDHEPSYHSPACNVVLYAGVRIGAPVIACIRSIGRQECVGSKQKFYFEQAEILGYERRPDEDSCIRDLRSSQSSLIVRLVVPCIREDNALSRRKKQTFKL
jgi:hypothetical protein